MAQLLPLHLRRYGLLLADEDLQQTNGPNNQAGG